MRFIFIISCFLTFFAGKVDAAHPYLILSASACGDYAIFQNGENGEKIMVDIRKMKVLCKIDSALQALTWIGDSTVLFRREGTKTYFLTLGVKNQKYTTVDSLENSSEGITMEDADFVSFPHQIGSMPVTKGPLYHHSACKTPLGSRRGRPAPHRARWKRIRSFF